MELIGPMALLVAVLLFVGANLLAMAMMIGAPGTDSAVAPATAAASADARR